MFTSKKKLKEMTLNELLDEVREYPYGSRHHNEITNHIVTNFNKKYRNQYILCTKGLYESGAIFRTSDDDNITYGKLKDNLNQIVPLEQFSPFYYCERSECEHNPLHRQIIVNTIVVDETYERAIMLKDSRGMVSLIGGHVDYNRNDYHRSLTDILNFNMKKELKEEVGESEIIKNRLPKSPTYILSCNGKKGNYYDMTHLIMLYVTVLPVNEFNNQIKLMHTIEKENIPTVLSVDSIKDNTRKNSVRHAIDIVKRRRRAAQKALEEASKETAVK